MGALAASRARWWEVVGNSEIVKSGIKRVGLDSDPMSCQAGKHPIKCTG